MNSTFHVSSFCRDRRRAFCSSAHRASRETPISTRLTNERPLVATPIMHYLGKKSSSNSRADQLPSGSVEVVTDQAALEERISHIVDHLANKTAAQPNALGKWAYWTQVGFKGGSESGSDGFEDAVAWTGRMMALHARCEDAKEGMNAFFEKRKPQWKL